MKKNYIAPALYSVQVRAEQMIAASSLSYGGKATDGEVLVKGSGDWDIFGENSVVDEESDSFFDE